MRWKLLLIFALAALVMGCTSTLETGYKPRLLGDSSIKRRAYYAAPFSPEARAAEMEREQEMEVRRPKPGY